MPAETPRPWWPPRSLTVCAPVEPVEVEAGKLVEAYRAIDTLLASEAALWNTSVDAVAAESPVRRAGREAAVAAATTEVVALTRESTVGWLAAAAHTAEVGAARAVADESLLDAVDAWVCAWGQWQPLAQAALVSLATAQPVVGTRALAASECLAEEGVVARQATPRTRKGHPVGASSTSPRVGAHVERLLGLFAHAHQAGDVATHTAVVGEVASPELLHGVAGREGEAKAEEWVELLADLWGCERTVARQARSLQASWARIDQARRHVAAARRRAHTGSDRRARTGRFIGHGACHRRTQSR